MGYSGAYCILWGIQCWWTLYLYYSINFFLGELFYRTHRRDCRSKGIQGFSTVTDQNLHSLGYFFPCPIPGRVGWRKPTQHFIKLKRRYAWIRLHLELLSTCIQFLSPLCDILLTWTTGSFYRDFRRWHCFPLSSYITQPLLSNFLLILLQRQPFFINPETSYPLGCLVHAGR